MPAIFFSITIFLSAFLLFQVQPMIGRFMLPWFGGGPAVWTTCMLFFQTMLLAGYGYAHWLTSRGRLRVQSWVHLSLLAVSLSFLPIAPRSMVWKWASGGDPSGRILLLLAISIGGPYLLLAATTPLLQHWFHTTRPGQPPWRWYALSNVGSFLALLSYPLVLEPYFTLRIQARIWSVLYALFVALCAWVAWRIRNLPAAVPEAVAAGDAGLSGVDIAMWLSLSACGSLLLLGTTSQITQEVAVFPFLWMAPLALYLMTFILTFESDRWYRRGLFAVLTGVLAPVTCAVISLSVAIPAWKQFGIYLGSLLVACMVCHGELARSRPSPRHLTAFYLTIAAGGALGGVFAAVIAPQFFSEFSEYPIGLAGACVLGFICWMRSGALSQWTSRNFAVRLPLVALMFGGFISIFAAATNKQPGIDARRNFYGILRVVDRTDKNGPLRELSHGRVQHGFQYLDPKKSSWPTTYYGPHSGVALALDALQHPRRVAVVGLGTGTLAAWGGPGDNYRFYEINPNAELFARKWFTFLRDTSAQTVVTLGDARIRLEEEISRGSSHDFDLIAVDAFTGDAIPMHLLTVESADIYRRRLAPGGILAIHISNRSLDLEPVTRGIARHLGWQARMVVVAKDLLDEDRGESNSRWVLMTEKAETFAHSKIRNTMVGWNVPNAPVIVWTDDFASLWPILRF